MNKPGKNPANRHEGMDKFHEKPFAKFILPIWPNALIANNKPPNSTNNFQTTIFKYFISLMN